MSYTGTIYVPIHEVPTSIFPTGKCFRPLEARSEPRQKKSEMLKKLKNIISCVFVFLAYRMCLSVLKLRGNRVSLTNNNALGRSIGYIVFAG